MSKGQDLYNYAKKIIPGGTMLLSKRPEMFLPELWPSYYSKAKGCKIWDLDGKEYIDMSLMGVGTNTLGYSNDIIDSEVRNVTYIGNMSTLNCPEEVYLAEKLVEMNPWSDMVRFARTGGEANSIAIRIARAATGKDNVAICGYHGWHDWYLSANRSQNDTLSNHLIPGLSVEGIPKSLAGTTYTFKYNDYDRLYQLVKNHNIGIIKMEVVRNEEPKNNFLKKVRELADKNGIVLIFDECTSGFRENYGGIHLKYKIEPDIVIYGKTIGNGYALTAIVGKQSVMDAAQKTFISSTFWTERIGPTASLKTLELMRKTKSWEIISKTGKEMSERWKKLAREYKLKIKVSGLAAISTYSFESNDHLKYKTFVTQEMLKKGFLASTNFYASTAHNESHLSSYFNALNEVFKKISDCERDIVKIDELLEAPVCHGGLNRLN